MVERASRSPVDREKDPSQGEGPSDPASPAQTPPQGIGEGKKVHSHTHTGHAIDLFLDSGAFGAWKRGIDLPIDEYISFVKKYEPWLWYYVNMDVIPGSNGKVIRTIEAMEYSARKSYENLQRMKDAGLKPLPVFHMGEQFHWLEKLLEDGEPYIGLSPNRKVHQGRIRQWLDKCFQYLVDKDGRPLVKTHAFGMTNVPLMLRYPWHTADSTSWVINYGNILVPVYVNGKADYTKPPVSVEMTGVKPTGRQVAGLGPITRAWVEQFLAEHGSTIGRVRLSVYERRRLYILYFLEVEKHCQGVKFAGVNQGGFNSKASTFLAGNKPLTDMDFSVVFASSVATSGFDELNACRGAEDRLLSYFDIRNIKDDIITTYVENGTYGWKNRKSRGLTDTLKKAPKANWNTFTYLNYRRLKLLERIETYGNQADSTTGES